MITRPRLARAALLCCALLAGSLFAQQPTGTIAGVVTDPSGAVIPGAAVTIKNKATQFTLQSITSRAGVYTTPALQPGVYEIRVEAKGFKTIITDLNVEVGRVAPADVRLEVGDLTQTVTVETNGVRVNPTQTALEGIVTEDLIRELPLNGRNFLDLGQLEPGMQLNAAEWPARPGYVRLAMGGQSGVTTRVTVDGIDISDENFGSVALNLSQEAIQEFQVSRSNFDPATGLTGSAAVNVVTRGGSNELHGSAFLFWRDDQFAARIAQQRAPFDREQFGFSLGGPFARNRLFWFTSYEGNNQDAAAATNFPDFPQFNGAWPMLFDERRVLARVDWNARPGIRIFSRFLHHWGEGVVNVGGLELTPLAVRNQTNQTAIGMDATAGRFTHSVRFGYTNYDNVADIAPGRISGVPFITDSSGRIVTVSLSSGGTIGYHGNAPVRRFQDNHELRYDSGFSFGGHALRWGTLVNFIRLNWFAAITAYAPGFTLTVNTSTMATCTAAGRRDDIFCYPVQGAGIGNGLGYWTEVPSHGLPYGGILNDRFHWYVADSWRVTPRLNFNFGLRWAYVFLDIRGGNPVSVPGQKCEGGPLVHPVSPLWRGEF